MHPTLIPRRAAIEFILLLAAATYLLLPASFAQANDPQTEYTAEDYQEDQDHIKVLVPAKARKLLEQLRRQKAKGVQEYPDATLLDVPRRALKRLKADERSRITVREDFDRILLDAGPIDTRRRRPPSEEPHAPKGHSLHLIQCSGPVRPDWLNDLDSVPGVRRVTYLPQNAYLLWADRKAIQQIKRSCPFIQWDSPFLPAHKIHPRLGRASGRELEVTLLLVDHAGVEESLARLKRIAKRALRPEHRRLGQVALSLALPDAALPELAELPDLIGIEPYVEPKLVDEAQGQILAGNLSADGEAPTGPGFLAALAGLGFPVTPASYPIVDVTDDGFDNGSASAPGHPDFYELGQSSNPSRVAYAVDRTADGDPHGVGGHGTLNAAIVGGYNNSAGFPFEDGGSFQLGLGIAPHGRVASSKIFSDSGSFGLVGSFTGLVSGSYGLGARISTNSWGAGTGGDYGSMDQEYDALVRDAQPSVAGLQPMTILFAAGNDGPGAPTTGSPGNAKNVITVGAAENVRTTGTDGCGIPDSAADRAQDIAFFSSRGPTLDGRAKPDLVAPGTHIQGAASQDPGFNGSGVCGGTTSPYFPAGQTLYTWSSGTSHSTPAAAGAAALLHQRFQSENGSAPSPAMVKAMLINSTRYLSGDGAGGDLPSVSQGWGEVDLTGFLTSSRIAKDQARIFAGSGESAVITGVIQDSSKPVKVALAWTDPPGPTVGAAYVNDLDLEVTAGGRVYRGNHFQGALSTEGGSPDPVNNVEAVFLPAGTTGILSARVKAANIAGDGIPGNADPTDQDFALSIRNVSESNVPVLRVLEVAVEDSAGNNSGGLDPGESAGLFIEVQNDGLADATGGNATLSTSSAGITVTQASSAYPTLSSGGSGANVTAFTVRLDAGVPCGSVLELTLSLQTAQGTFNLPASLRVGAPSVTTLLNAGFESGSAGFAATGLWHLETGCRAVLGGHSPVTTFYYGRSGQCNYDAGNNSGTLTSPEIALPGAPANVTLTFNHLMGREPGLLGFYDIAQLEISRDGGPYAPIGDPYDSTDTGFVPLSVDLSGYAGERIRLRWSFNTVDGQLNRYEGWHVDDIRVEASDYVCQPVGPGPSNHPPTLDPVGDRSVDEGQPLQFTLTGSDPDGDALSFSASNLPPGAAFSGAAFSWTPGSDQAGSYPNVRFEVSDGALTDSEEITITVNNVPLPSSISGTVTSTSGEILPDTLMTLVKRNAKPSFKLTTRTDLAGQYRFADLTAGQYNLTASRKGYNSLRLRADLGPEEDKTLDFVLKPKD